MPTPARIPRRDGVLQPVQDVVPQAGLVVIDEDGGADVHRADQDKPLPDAAHADLFRHLVGNVQDFLAALGVEPEVMCMGCHLELREQ